MGIELDQAIDLALVGMRRVAVVGASTDPFRASNSAIATLTERGFDAVPVNPLLKEVLGLRCYPDLASVPGRIDVVDVFRREEHLPGVARAAVARDDVAAVWNQLGLQSPEARAIVLGAGRGYVENACLEATLGRRGLWAKPAPRLESPVVLLDLDDTILDHDASERAAVAETLAAFGLPSDDATVDVYVRVNAAAWAEYRDGRLDPLTLRTLRWERTFAELALTADVPSLSASYIEAFSRSAVPLPGAVEAVWWLSRRSRVVVATNGFAEVQAARLAAVGLADVVRGIASSEEVGVAKPDPALLHLAVERAGGVTQPGDVTIVGDQLGSDIAAGTAFGAATVWIAPDEAEIPADAPAVPDRRVSHLADLA